MNEKDARLPIRLPRAMLDAVRAEAQRRDETLSQVVRRALRDYLASAKPAPRQIPRQIDLEEAIAATRSPSRPALMLADLDAAGAADHAYREVLSSGSKDPLRPGETYRDRLVQWAGHQVQVTEREPAEARLAPRSD